MSTIIVTPPIASHSALERLNLFAGRKMGEQEFDRLQAYVDRRLAPILTGKYSGIVHGLEVREADIGADDGITLRPGLALAANGQTLGLLYPLRVTWQHLIEEYLEESDAADASGVYYLTLRRHEAYVDSTADITPCQRSEFDPTRDAQRVLVGTLGLHRLGIDPAALATQSRERIENWVAANNVGAEFLSGMPNSVPVGLLAIENAGVDDDGATQYTVPWYSQAAGRFMAVKDAGYHVLMNQVTQAFKRTLLAAQGRPEEQTVGQFLSDNLQLDFLPAAGQLSEAIITDISSTSPQVTWLPQHLGVDMVAIPESAAGDLLDRHLARRVVDLRQPASDKLRLLLAVEDHHYKGDLLDYPDTDDQLESDVYRYFQRAYQGWLAWIGQYHRLYAVVDDDLLEPEDLRALDLPETIAAPQLPESFYQQVVDESERELGTQEDSTPHFPYDQGRPAYPSFYRAWGTEEDGRVSPPAVPEPSEDGLVIQYAIGENALEAIDNQIRATRERLEKTRDYLMLQRQQLDNQTVSLAALAGGVAGDGSGLQVARWLPFTQLKAREPEPAADPEPRAVGAAPVGVTSLAATGATNLSITPAVMSVASSSASTKSVNTFNPASLAADTSFGKLNSYSFINPTTSFTAKNSATNLIYSNTLRKNPTIFSTLQFTLNNTRLDKIAEAPKQALTKPAFEAKEFRFGVLEHVRPEIQEYKKTIRGMRELISTLAELFDKADANSLRKVLESYGAPTPIEDLELNVTAENEDELELAGARIYEAQFNASQILTKQIAYVEARYNRIESQLEGRLRARIKKEAELEKLMQLIGKATQELENIEKRRVELLGDYGTAQRLLDDDWLSVYHLNQHRTKVLTTGVKGLYYVRERQAGISVSLADPLPLRYGKADDIVPGCDWDQDPELPEELDDFFETLLEIPMKDWVAIRDLSPLIPPPVRLDYMAHIRQVRLARKTNKKRVAARLNLNTQRPVRASLYNLRLQSQSLLSYWSGLSYPTRISSAKQRAREAALVTSLEDLASGSRGKLQQQSQILMRRLEQAIDCLLEHLNELAPSLRLQWAQLAEDDRLRVEHTHFWPGLERAEREDFNAMRTVAELIEWWFKQIDSETSSNGRAAMRNMIRATLIQSALGDPTEILQGEVKVPPRRLAPGEPLRLKLNRAVIPGTVLHLLDTRQRVVATLNVDDDDDSGTLAQITRVTHSAGTVNTQYRVVASKATRQLAYLGR